MKNWPFWIGCLAAILVIVLYLQFFKTDQTKYQIMYAAIFICCVLIAYLI